MSSGGPTALQRLTSAARRRTPYAVHGLIRAATDRSPLARRAVARVHGDLRHADVTIAHGAAAGLLMNSADTVCGYTRGHFESTVQDALSALLRHGMTVYDIGANIGFFTLIAARAVGPGGRVVALEPLPENVRWLRHNVALNGFDHVQVVEAAAGASDGRTAFASGDNPGWGVVSASGELDVELISLDDRIASGALPAPDLVKLDIEGAEIDALAGLRQTLARHAPIVIVELHGTLEPVTAALTAAGLRIERIDPREPDVNAHLLARPEA